MKVKGQGATEYLLILAAVLVVVAVAVYYVTRAGAAAPNLTVMAYKSDNTIKVKATGGTDTVPAGKWDYQVYLETETAPSPTVGTFDLTPTVDQALYTVTQSGTYKVRIRHIPSGKYLFDSTVYIP
jgi:hypothetical protein